MLTSCPKCKKLHSLSTENAYSPDPKDRMCKLCYRVAQFDHDCGDPLCAHIGVNDVLSEYNVQLVGAFLAKKCGSLEAMQGLFLLLFHRGQDVARYLETAHLFNSGAMK